ncbi:MAG: CYTH domain-containing protein [Candidatus Dadabacteria bacterium]|nr:CYTH domain-containing protein [Candidatus Dadabacteria bacterium]
MSQEIERKFLVKELPADLENYPHSEIIQGYLIITDNDIEVRIRKKGDKYFETVKAGSGLVRKESEKEITKEVFFDHWPLTEGKRVEKVRYEIEYGGKLIELDIYSGDLEGLVVAEVEFDSEEESVSFTPPEWFGEEVTHDERYKNKNLALHGKPSV